MKKIIFLILMLPIIACAAAPMAPWERFMDPTNNWTTVKMYRMPVPHGWLVVSGRNTIYVPDEHHEWTIDPQTVSLLSEPRLKTSK